MQQQWIDKIIQNIGGNRIRLHLFFWISVITGYMIEQPYLIGKLGMPLFAVLLLFRFTTLAAISYLNLYVFIPFLKKKNSPPQYLALVGASVLLMALFQVYVETHIYNQAFKDESDDFYDFLYFYASEVVCNLWYIGSTMALKFAKQFFQQSAKIKQIEIEKLQTEIKYLMGQINPHFMFNALNSIYVLIDKNNQTARHTLTQFSDMLRYQLYECSGETVNLKNEIAYLKNYIDLQKLRKSNRYDIQFETPELIDDIQLPPMLLIGFVENAFKHLSHHKDKENYIKIGLNYTQNSLVFNVKNTKEESFKAPKDDNNGIGLKNIRRRLALQFPNRHTLDIDNQQDTFSIHLTLHLE
jgi:two-component system, LytTR family, sensor kinase